MTSTPEAQTPDHQTSQPQGPDPQTNESATELPPSRRPTMQAITQDRYGSPDVLSLRQVDRPEPADDEVLVRVIAASVNPYDWHMIRGVPYFIRLMFGFRAPKHPIPGADFAGVVEMIGADVTDFSIGDEVFGGTGSGTLAEYVAVAQRNVVHKPSNVTFEQASGVAMTGITALQALRDTGKLVSGQHVLVNGASGGVGSMAVQMAKAMGARGHSGVQHPQRRDAERPRRGSRHRLHAGRLREGRQCVRPHRRCRRQSNHDRLPGGAHGRGNVRRTRAGRYG